MLICPQCSSQYPEGKKFCKKCGAPLQPVVGRDPRIAAARELCAAKLAQDPFNIELLLEYGELLSDAGALDDAAKELEKVLSIEKDNLKALDLLASIYVRLGRTGISEEYLQRVTRLPGRTSEHYQRLARIQFDHLNQRPRAMHTLGEALLLFPEDVRILKLQFDLLKVQGEQEKLIDVGRKILQLDPSAVDILRTMANAALAIGDKARAYSLFEDLKGVCATDERAILFLVLRDLEKVRPGDLDALKSIHESLKDLDANKLKQELEEDELNLYDFCSALCGIGIGQADDKSRRFLLDYLKEEESIPSNWQEIIRDGFATIVNQEFETYVLESLMPELDAALESDVSPLAREVFGYLQHEIGNVFERRHELGNAKHHYWKAAELAPDNGVYAERFKEVSRRIRKKEKRVLFTISALAAIAFCVALSVFLSKGRLRLIVKPPASVSILKGDKIVSQLYETDEVLTDFLWFGKYEIKAEREGYERIERLVSVGFGRRTYVDTLTLVPVFGGLAINSEPPGAQVLIDGDYAGTTPFRSKSVHAKSTTVAVKKEGYTRYQRQVTIVKDRVMDLGLVSLEMSPEEQARLKEQEAAELAAAAQREREARLAEMEAARKEREAKIRAEQEAFQKRSAPFRARLLARKGNLVDAETIVTDKQPSSGTCATVRGVNNVLMLHPLRKEPGYVERHYPIPAGGGTLVAQYCSARADCGENESDFVARIVVIDANAIRHALVEHTIAYSRGWVEQHFSLSEFAGQTVILRFEAVANGWCSEWAGLGAFYVVE